MKSLLFIFTLFLSFALFAQEDKPIDVPQIAVKLGLDKTIDFEGMSITFVKVVTDSRCPKNVECMWAGEAKVLVSIGMHDQEAEERTIVFKNGISVIAGLFNNKELQFLQLAPYPDATISVADRAPYFLLMRAIEK